MIQQPAFYRKYPRRWLCVDPIRQTPIKSVYTLSSDLHYDSTWIIQMIAKDVSLTQKNRQLETKLKSNQRFIDAITEIGRLVDVPYPDPVKIVAAVRRRLALDTAT